MAPDTVKLERIVVAVDLDDASTEAARWTAQHLVPDEELVLVYALDVRDPPRYLGDDADRPDAVEDVRRAVRERLGSLRERLDTPARIEVGEGRPDEVARATADEAGADLVVAGASSSTGDDVPALGRTAEKLVDRSGRPLLLLRRPPARDPGRLLVAVDDGPEAKFVVAWAVLLARRWGARVTVLHVFQSRYAGVGRLVSGVDARQRLEPEQRDQARAWLADLVQEAGLDPEGVRFEIAEGDPEEKILAQAEEDEVDLLVLGNRSGGAVERALLGSVARDVVRRAPGSVLVVSPRE